MMEKKKNPKIDVNRRYSLHLNIGLCISLVLVIAAFEWPAPDNASLTDLGSMDDDFEDIMEIPPTDQPPPPPPKIQHPEIKEVDDEEEIEEEIELDLDVEVTEESVFEDVEFEPASEEVDEVFDIVEDQPKFPGGMEAFYKFVSDNMKYPSQARRMGVEGRVFVQFIVDENGLVTDVNVVKGIGAGLDEEAARVLKQSPKFEPGKQRGRPVKVRMVMPIIFSLGN